MAVLSTNADELRILSCFLKSICTATPVQLTDNSTEYPLGVELMPRINRKVDNLIRLGTPVEDWAPDLPHLQAHADWRVSKVKDFIDKQNGNVGTALDYLCRELDIGITAAHLSRLFRQETGLGIREYSRRLRMDTAARKLESTALPIKHIAADLGYRGPADFFRQFKQQFNVTPCEFRILQRSRRSSGSRTA
jgi:AraC-like DNA-binding protein